MGAKGDPTPEVIAPPPPAAAGQGAADKRPPPLERPGSGESVDQPNPFASMLVHLMDGGKGALMSPSHRAVLQCAVRAVDSPQSPEHLTPLGLLSSHEGAATATPELGKGDLQAWIDRRGMRAVLNSPAVADLRRMWGAMREGASARAAAEAAASEAEALRRELASARDALAQLSEEHEAALAAAADGKEWAEAEVARAREAAAHMMALADQIQATFAMCEAEKCNLAEELESALARAEEAERLARGVAGKAAASEEQRAAAEALKAELAAAQQAAEAARAEARAAQAAAAASTEDLTAIRLQLQQAEEALAAAGEQGSTGSAAPEAAATPMTKLRMQLHSVHEALASLHATSGRAVQGPASPQVGRMVAASRMGLSHAGHLLEADAQQLQAANEELRGLVAEVHAKVQQLSPAGTPDLKRALVPSCDAGGAPGEEQRQLAFESETSSPEGGHQEAGSVTVDFQELREVLVSICSSSCTCMHHLCFASQSCSRAHH